MRCRLFATSIALVATGSAALAAPPSPHFSGRWTPVQNWGATETHLILLPGTDGYHSQILWWQHGHDEFKFGGLRGWDPADNDCQSFPATFVDVEVDSPQVDIFCAGHTPLADGRLFIAGGTQRFTENGIVETRLYDPVTKQFSAGPDMDHRRWYSTATQLADNRVLITSGSKYARLDVYGGLRATESVPSDTDLHRFAVVRTDAAWDPAISRGSEPIWPSALEGHSMVVTPSPRHIFGGRDTSGNYSDDTWRMFRNPNQFESEYEYDWVKITIPGEDKPDARFEHAAIWVPDGTTEGAMFVVGGRSNGGTLSDVWRLRIENNVWTWTEISPSGTGPGALEAHAAIYDRPRRRMLIFGGRSSSAAAPTSTDVWALNFSVTFDADSVTWEKCTPAGDPPVARYDHTMSWAPDIGGSGRREGFDYALVFGGRDTSHALLQTLHTLWINNSSDPDSNGALSWTRDSTTGAAPSARTQHVASTVPGILDYLVFGGETAGGVVDRQTYVLTLGPVAGVSEWDSTSTQPAARKNHAGLLSGLVYERHSEVYDPAAGTIDELDAPHLQLWYPQTFQTPEGVFVPGPHRDSTAYYYDMDASTPQWRPFPGAAANQNSGFVGGAAVQFEPGRILKAGTRDQENQNSNATGLTATINLNASHPDSLWKPSRPMTRGRVNHNLTVLPTGEVLATGGTSIVSNGVLQGPIFTPELWRADSLTADSTGVWYGGWGELDTSLVKRDYHSAALLLPDGRVLVGGGNADSAGADTIRRKRVNIFCPPYLFRTNGDLATRPQISDAPRAVNYGADFKVESPDAGDIVSVCWIKPGATTHGQDQNQRYLELDFTDDADTLDVTSPASPGSAPPGDYLMFILVSHPDDATQGVPSIATWIRVSADSVAPDSATDFLDDLVSTTSIGLTWESPGDDDNTGTAQEYDIRYSTSQITEANWHLATKCTGEDLPEVAGSYQGYQITGLQQNTKYWIAMKTRDEAWNWSLMNTPPPVTTINGGGGGLSAAKVLDDEAAAAGQDPAPPVRAMRSQRAGTSSINPTTLSLVAEFNQTSGDMAVAVTRLAASEISGIGEGDSASILLQHPDGQGGWVTQAQFNPNLNDLIGLGPTGGHRRVVCLGDYNLVHVASPVSTGGGSDTLTLAEHSGQGDVYDDVVLNGSFAVAQGETLTVTYGSASATGDEIGWYVLVGTGAGATATWQKPAREAVILPRQFVLWQNRPNPFSGRTTIRFDLPTATQVKIEIFDLFGRRIRTLADRYFRPGFHTVDWDQRDRNGVTLRAGIFVYRMSAGAFQSQRKMVLVP